jgi:hypothetical protein
MEDVTLGMIEAHYRASIEDEKEESRDARFYSLTPDEKRRIEASRRREREAREKEKVNDAAKAAAIRLANEKAVAAFWQGLSRLVSDLDFEFCDGEACKASAYFQQGAKPYVEVTLARSANANRRSFRVSDPSDFAKLREEFGFVGAPFCAKFVKLEDAFQRFFPRRLVAQS